MGGGDRCTSEGSDSTRLSLGPMPGTTRLDVTLLDDQAAMNVVRAAVAAGEPFSMLRLNDGEAVAMSFDDDMSLIDVAYLQSHWGGERVSIGAAKEVRTHLDLAVSRADLVGIRNDVVGVDVPDDLLDRTGPDIRHFVRSELPLRADEKAVVNVVGARRIVLHQRSLLGIRWTDEQQLCSCWVHWEFLASGFLDELLRSVDQVGLVTPRLEVAHLIERRYGIRTRTVGIPDKFVEANRPGAHVPDRFRSIRSELRFEPGTLVLVGAGIPGKVYCDWLKQAGCVALDIGAVFDAWVGKASRPMVLQSRFGVSGGTAVPDHLRLTESPERSERVLVPRWKPAGARE